MKILRKNIIGFIVGGILYISINCSIASNLLASQLNYSNTKSTIGVTNVDGALTELYNLAKNCLSVAPDECKDGYVCEKSITPEELGGTKEMIEGQTYYGILYLDPRKSGNGYTSQTNCSSSKFTSNTGTIEGCMRFYIYNEDENYYYAILDHNTTNSLDFGHAQSQVLIDTKNWSEELRPRNISAYEIYMIVQISIGQISWKTYNGSELNFNRNYSWLVNEMYNCTNYGCETEDNNVSGYWTSDMRDSSYAWYVGSAYLRKNQIGSIGLGVRPVIRISKI